MSCWWQGSSLPKNISIRKDTGHRSSNPLLYRYDYSSLSWSNSFNNDDSVHQMPWAWCNMWFFQSSASCTHRTEERLRSILASWVQEPRFKFINTVHNQRLLKVKLWETGKVWNLLQVAQGHHNHSSRTELHLVLSPLYSHFLINQRA